MFCMFYFFQKKDFENLFTSLLLQMEAIGNPIRVIVLSDFRKPLKRIWRILLNPYGKGKAHIFDATFICHPNLLSKLG